MTTVRLAAPFAGWAARLDEVPDPVFAERMMGDGVAIDPLDGVLRAPADAEVIAVAPTSHSVTLRLANGAELLIHIGLETVGLGGRGFSARVVDGAHVKAGDALIAFDLDSVAEGAKSLITPIVIANEGYRVSLVACDRLVAAGEALMEVIAERATETGTLPVGDDTAVLEVGIPMANGVHARPAARIAATLKPFAAQVSFAAHGREANARSPVALMTLALKHGDNVRITGKGADARAAVTAVAALIETGMGEAHAEPAAVPASPAAAASAQTGPLFRGVRAAPGLAIGPIVQFRATDADVPEQGQGLVHEASALDGAMQALSAELDDAGNGPAGEIAVAHRALLEDPELLESAQTWLGRGKSAGHAWRMATRGQSDAIRATGDPLLIERIADLIDIERRLIARLMGDTAPAMPRLPDRAILIADELLPSQFMALDAARLGGVATARGGPTSHVAILAASAGVPMLVAAGAGVLEIAEGRTAILDADARTLDGDPSSERLQQTSERLLANSARHAAEAAAAADDCIMADGTRIEIFANLASAEEAERAVRFGAEGCGLLRTEFLFLDRADAPSEEEQRESYAAIAAALQGRPLIVRTLDIGGDKPVPYLPFPHEDNPALGNRGVRLGLQKPELLATQLRAILAGVPAAQCRVMLPMIVDAGELRTVRAIFDEAAKTVGLTERVPLGVMIETPSAAILADSIAVEADFLSIGSNDLTQYALAADRGNPAVADRIDALHPAVLRLIAEAARGGAKHGRWTGVCGGIASDPRAAAILIGLGVTELSATAASIPALKAAVRKLSFEDCKALAVRALAAESATEVRALIEGER
ncbi:phosphoenolpyruvate--protein phosphotransferase [Sphingomonas sp. LaA6.9]|uniref:phosphoenolpyruvate--protein phosphotransferase n=1 Tax=Sphingomonas sp. LaA6.9 TaxID=2919914 RepID=UPI001F5001E8|nr:phosphoenolpyruvate--protein phosphotransferase [Sphingomonas sp. LaA6.9]MCJ8158273.1 phosphoenolpyruvate--protein phosphotransferase [Sphingomonas sp. LaA6.9]